jgi:hypothetical protein
MDVQTTYGRQLRHYVTSYVSKWKDVYANEALYSSQVLPYQAAYRHVSQLQPCEPEMWLCMSPIKFAWSSSGTKDYTVPQSCTVSENKDDKKYTSRPKQMENYSFLQAILQVDNKHNNPKPYKDGNTLVCIKFVSPFNNEHFFQQLLMKHPHRSIAQLKHPKFDEMPEQVRFFASVIHLMSEKYTNDVIICEHFCQEGNKDVFVETIMAHISALWDILYLWERIFYTS